MLLGQDIASTVVRRRGVYGEKANYVRYGLREKVGGRITFEPIEGGMCLWLTLPDGVDMQAYVKKCLEHKLALVPGSAFFVDDAAPCQSVRCNFSTPTMAQIDKGTTIMREVLDRMMG